MKLILNLKPKRATIVCGFPGFGFVGTISTEFLISHLNAKSIGHFSSNELSPIAAIHQGKIIQPIEIYYDKKTNIVIVHALTQVQGKEWDIANAIEELSKQINAKEVICLEGIGNPTLTEQEPRSFIFSGKDKKSKLTKLTEGIVMGVTGALILKSNVLPITCIFAETNTATPDSRASAKIVESLDNYLGLKIPYEPLLKKAQQFEGKIKGIVENTQKIKEQQEEKGTYYMG